MVAKMELASAYVTLNVSTAQMGKQIGRMFGQAESQASTTGKRMGKSIQKGLDSASSSTVEDLQKRLTTGEEKLAAATERGSKRRSAAARGVEIAEAKLNEVKEKGNAKNSQIMAAEDRLIKAREKYTQVSRDAVTQISGYAKDVQASRAALDELSATSTRSGGAIRKAFAGIGSTIGQSFTGATSIASSAMTGIRTAASVAASAVKSTFAGVGSFLKNVFTGNFSGAFNQIVTGAKTAGSAVSTAFSNVWGGFTNGIANARSSIASTSQNMVSSFSGAASRTGEAVRGGLSRGFEGIRAVASRSAAENFAAFTSGAGRAASTVGGALSSGFRSTASAAAGAASNGFRAFTSGAGSAASAIGSRIASGFRSTVSVAASAAKGGASALVNGFSSVHNTIRNGLSGSFSGLPSLAGRTGSSAGSQLSSGIMSHVSKLPAMVGAVVGVGGLSGILMGGFNRLADMQRAEILFKHAGLDTKAVKNEMTKLDKAVTGTSVSLNDAANQASMLMQSGVEYGKPLDDSVQALTSMASIAPDGAKGVGLVMNQIKALGKLQAQDAKQLTERQIPVWTLLSKSMGKSIAEVRKLSEDGKISYEDFVKAVNEGSGSLAKDLGETITTKITNLKNAFNKLGAAIITPIMGGLTKGADGLYSAITKRVVPAIEGFYKWLGSGAKSATEFKNTMMWLGAAIGGVVSALTGVATAMWAFKALGAIFSIISSPVMLLAAAFGAVVGIAVVAYKKVGWFKDLVDNFFWRIKLGVGLFKDAWNNADKSVSASGIPGFFQGLGKLARTVLDSVVDLVKKVAKSFWDYFGPALEDIGPKFKDAFKNAGKVLGDIAEAVKKVGKFLGDTADYWVPFATGIGLVAGAIVAYNVVAGIAAGISTVWAGAMAIITSPITLIIIGLGLLIGAIIWAYKNIDWFRDGVNAAWGWIKDTISGFLTWWTETFWPLLVEGLKAVGGFFVWLWQDIIVPVWGFIKGVISGFLDWWTQTFWPVVQNVISWLGDLFTWLWHNIIEPVWTGIKIAIAIVITAIILVIGGLILFITDVLAPIFVWLWQNVIVPAWNGIGNAIKWVWENVITPVWNAIKWFIENVLVPVFNWFRDVVKIVWDAIGAAIQWVWNSIVKPVWDAINWFINNILVPVFNWFRDIAQSVWNAIGAAIQWVWNSIIKPVWDFIKWYIDNVLVPVFNWLRDISKAVWDAMGVAIKWVWDNVIKPVWDGIKWFIDNILVPAFNFLRDGVKAAWDFIGNIISKTWNWIRDTVLNPMGDFLQKNVVDFFRKTKDGIENVWNKVKDVAKKPIGFVIDTIIKDGVIGTYNKVAGTLGVPKIAEDFKGTAGIKGWATGGYTGKGRKYDEAGVVHKDEYVIRKESTNKIRQEHGLSSLNYLNQTGDLEGAFRMSGQDERRKGSQHGIAAGPGSPTYAGLPSFGNALQHQIAATGSLNVKGSGLDGSWNIGSAATVWNGMAGVKVGTSLKGDVPSVTARQVGGAPWAGYYDPSGISLNIGQGWANPRKSRPIVAAHEVGHALGLPHSMGTGGGASIMDYGTMYNLSGPTDKDAKALQSIYPGGSGKGKSVGEGGGIGNPLAFIMDLLKDKFKKKFPKAAAYADMAWGAGKKIIQAAIDKIAPFGDDSGGGGPVPEGDVKDWMTKALKMKNIFSDSNLSLGVRRAMQESGGNVRAINNWDSNAQKGTPSKGLMQVIDPTFRSNMEPGHGDIWNPIDNILASINYTLRTYGSLGAGWGRAGGYADGGLVQAPSLFDGGGKLEKGVQFIDHQRDKPDYVLTHEQWAAMYSIAENTATGGQGMVINGGIHGHSAEEVGREVEKRQKRREALYA